MELNKQLAMTAELDAELVERRQARADAERIERIRAAAVDGDSFQLVGARADTMERTDTLDTSTVASKLRKTSGPFRKAATEALGVIRTRAAALVDLAIEADVLAVYRPAYSGYTAKPEVHVVADRDEDRRAVATLAAAGVQLGAAYAELEQRVELEILRADDRATLGWFARRDARRVAAQQLLVELDAYMEALEALPDGDDVELTAADILAARADARAEVEAASN